MNNNDRHKATDARTEFLLEDGVGEPPDDPDWHMFADEVSVGDLDLSDARKMVDIGEFETDFSVTIDLAEMVQQRLEKELRGAWRAGYDYLYVCNPRHQEVSYSHGEPFTLPLPKMVPSDLDDPPVSPIHNVVEQYDLRDVTREDIERARDGEL